MPRRPNIILCIFDQLRAFEVGCYGNPVIRTPALDRLAREGVRWQTAVTNYPVCMAARSALLSGQYNRTCTGGVSNVNFKTVGGDCAMPEYPFAGRPHLPDATLPELLRAQGYHTAAIGKWHIHSWPQDVGFDEYVIPRVHHCHTGQSYTENGGPEFVPSGYSLDFEVDRVGRFLRRRAAEQEPFFLYANISPPHCPMSDAPDAYTTMYGRDDVPVRRNAEPGRRLDHQDYHFKVYRWDFRHYSFHLPYTEPLPEGFGLRDILALYYGATTWADSALGRMLTALDEAGLADETIVVVTSDHGDNLGSHGLVQKGTPNEESIRVPLLARWPGRLPAGAVAGEGLASLVDLAPTLLELSGLEPPPHMHGVSLAPALRGEPGKAPDAGIVEMGHGVAVRTADRMAFIPFDAERRLAAAGTRLYDLQADPYELQNLAGDPAHAAEQAELERRIREWDARTPWMAPVDGEAKA
jgi:choline-sulfatase